jgi:AraC family transcriptional regulator, L-rhamnose operon regulatory protein RhaS
MAAAHLYRIAQYPGTGEFPFHIGSATVEGQFHQHTHDFVELVVVTGGSGRHVINGRPYRVGGGDVFVFNLGAAHGFEQAHRLEMVNIMFPPWMLAGAGPDTRSLAGFQALFVVGPASGEEFRCMLRLDRAGLAQVQAMLKRMLDEFNGRRQGCQTLLRAWLLELVVFLSRRYSHRGVTVEGPAGGLRLAEVGGFMGANFREELRLPDLAARAKLSRRHFIRQFRRVYGTTPLQHVLDLRLRHAAQLLSASSRSVTAIAYESGFRDSNYFTRQFARRFGVAPTVYRARAGTRA